MKGPKNLDEVMKNYPNNSCVLLEDRNNFKKITLLVIKDKFGDYFKSDEKPKVRIKGGFIKYSRVLAQYLVVNIKNKYVNKYYKFYFDYNNSDSLKLIFNLISQSHIYIIMYDKNNYNRVICIENKFKSFFKQYIQRCLKGKFEWTSDEYNQLIYIVDKTFHDTALLWSNLGDEIYANKF